MDLGISGKTALVFGGSRGMGRACAMQLAREGVAVTIAARNPATLEQAAAEISRETGIGVGWVSADLTQAQGRDAAMAACPHPDILINYKRVTLTFSTHSDGGLTDKDFEGARKVDALL